jgi:pyrroline-5-carboxylate reductase
VTNKEDSRRWLTCKSAGRSTPMRKRSKLLRVPSIILLLVKPQDMEEALGR